MSSLGWSSDHPGQDRDHRAREAPPDRRALEELLYLMEAGVFQPKAVVSGVS